MKIKNLLEKLWVLWVTVPLVLGTHALGLLLIGTSAIDEAAIDEAVDQFPEIPPLTLDDWNNVPEGGIPQLPPWRFRSYTVGDESMTSMTRNLTLVPGQSITIRLEDMRHLRFRDGRIVPLPEGIEIEHVSTMLNCWDPCPMTPVYKLKATSGATISVDGNGQIASGYFATDNPDEFPFLQTIWPQDRDAPGEIRP